MSKEVTQEIAPRPWLSAREAAARMGWSLQHLYNLTHQKKIRHIKRGTRIYFPAAWLDEYEREKSEVVEVVEVGGGR